jgi:subtilisin family serine protease
MSPRIFRSRGLIPLLAVLLLAIPAVPASGGQSPARTGSWGPDLSTTKTPKELVEWAKQVRSRAQDDFRPASGRVVAKFRSDAAARTVARRMGWRILDRVLGDGSVLLGVPAGQRARAFARFLDRRSEVEYAELDYPVRAFAEVTDWGADAMQVPEAHASGATGAGVTIAVVDSGVDYNHEDLAGNIWTNLGEIPDDGIDNEGNGFVDDVRGYDFMGPFFTSPTEDNDPIDVLGHGTHVAGIAAAEDNDIGVLGVAPDATIMPVRVLDDQGAGFDSTISMGIRYATDNGADIINMSLGGLFPSAMMRDAVQYALDAGVTVVAASGNEFLYSLPSYPAGIPDVVSVAAADKKTLGETKTWWSNWGNVDFLAPGESVLSSVPYTSSSDPKYLRFSGTSMASPHVAGALALVNEVHPGFGPTELEQALAATSGERYFSGKDEVAGSGFPDAEAATGTLPADQVELYRDPYLIASDGRISTITLRVLDGAGTPQAGVTGTFSVVAPGAGDADLSSTAFTTDANGEAETELTLDDFFGVTTVTASSPSFTSRDIRVMVEDDRIRVDDASIGTPSEDEFFEEFAAGKGEASSRPATPAQPQQEEGEFGRLILDPGETVVVTAAIGNHRMGETRRASVEFSVTNPDGDPVPELHGVVEPIDVGFGFLEWASQERVDSTLLTIPETAVPGRYELTVTATTEESGKQHTTTTPFWVGRVPQVLVIREPFYFNAETFNYFDFTNPTIDWGLKEILDDDLGLSFVFVEGFPPPAGAMRRFSTVIWLGGWEFFDTFELQTYLDRGGNVLLSGEVWASQDRLFPSTFFRDYLHLTGVMAPLFPDVNNQIYPGQVDGLAGGILDGETLDINSYDLNTTGEPTALFTDELVAQNDVPEASSQFAYESGLHDPALAARHVDSGRYRVMYTGFGVEAIDDAGSDVTASELFDELIFDVFNPAPDITRVVPRRLTTRGGRFRILGTNFQPTGETTVRVGKRRVQATVLSRTEIVASLPRGFPVGLYNVTVRNSIGPVAREVGALRVTRP